jgi:hypothetical protein
MTTRHSPRLDRPIREWPGRMHRPQVLHVAVLLAWMVGCLAMASPALHEEPPAVPHQPVPGDPRFKVTRFRGTLRGAVVVLGDDPAYAALRGLTGLGVVVEPLDPGLARYGVAPPEVQRAVEERLRQAGLRVLSADALATTPGTPTLQLAIEMLPPGFPETLTYLMRLSLLQQVVLVRDPTLQVPGVPTWVLESLSSASAARLPEMRGDVLALVGRFLTTYQYVTRPHEQGWPPGPRPAAPP